MDCVSPILDVATRLWGCIAKRAVYILHLPQNLDSLRTAMEELKNLYEGVKERVEREENRQKKRTHVVDGWLRNVEAMEDQVKEILAKGAEEIQKKWPKNCCASYKLGKMVLGKMDAVTVKKREGSNFIVVAEPLPIPPVIERPLDKTVGQDLLFGKVWKWLEDDGEQVSSIGLYGMGGVGKTTLLTRINNELLKTRLEFDAVIWVTVSRPANVEKVQRVLFNKLEIPIDKWEGRSEDERAEEIFNVLKTKKFVLLLDDIWERLDLSEVGIPPLNPQDKLKMVLTTRSKNVCQDMEVTESIEVNCLPWEDAFALFQTKVGADTLNSHPDIPQLAEMVAKECCGLPLTLITIGRAMAGTKTPQEWEKKIEMLKNYPAKFPVMSQNVDISRENWTDPIQRKHFIDLCLQEANKGYRSGGGLKSSAWPRIAEELEKLLGKRYTSKQLKNGWDYMKRQYLIWSKMMTMTGHGYNSVTKTFDWPVEKWEEYLQKYPEAKQFRLKPLANMEELEALFGGVLATGSKNWSSGGVIASGAEESSTHSTSMPNETSISLEEDENLPRNTNDEAEGSKKKQKKGKKEQNQEEMNRIINVLENFEGPSVKECMKILKKLLTYEDPLYYVAINGFCKKKEYREVWVEMESDQERMGWIQSLRK